MAIVVTTVTADGMAMAADTPVGLFDGGGYYLLTDLEASLNTVALNNSPIGISFTGELTEELLKEISLSFKERDTVVDKAEKAGKMVLAAGLSGILHFAGYDPEMFPYLSIMSCTSHGLTVLRSTPTAGNRVKSPVYGCFTDGVNNLRFEKECLPFLYDKFFDGKRTDWKDVMLPLAGDFAINAAGQFILFKSEVCKDNDKGGDIKIIVLPPSV